MHSFIESTQVQISELPFLKIIDFYFTNEVFAFRKSPILNNLTNNIVSLLPLRKSQKALSETMTKGLRCFPMTLEETKSFSSFSEFT